MIRKLRETFRPGSSYRAFFVTIITFALAHGLYNSAYAATIRTRSQSDMD